MMNVTVQMVVYCVILVLLAIPLGSYMGKVMNGEHVFLSGVLQPVERVIYRVLKIDPEEAMYSPIIPIRMNIIANMKQSSTTMVA